MSKSEIIEKIIELIKSKSEISKTMIFAVELSEIILIYNLKLNALFKLEGMETTIINEDVSDLELLVILNELES